MSTHLQVIRQGRPCHDFIEAWMSHVDAQREGISNFWKGMGCVRLSEIGTGEAGCEGQEKTGRGEPMPLHPLCFHAVWKKRR